MSPCINRFKANVHMSSFDDVVSVIGVPFGEERMELSLRGVEYWFQRFSATPTLTVTSDIRLLVHLLDWKSL